MQKFCFKLLSASDIPNVVENCFFVKDISKNQGGTSNVARKALRYGRNLANLWENR